MGLTVSQMITAMRRIIGVDSDDDGFSDAECLQKINQSYWDVTDRLNFRETELTIPFTTDTAARKYRLPVDTNAFRGMAIFDDDGLSHRLDQMLLTAYDNVYNSTLSDTASNGIPTNYVRENDYIILWPTPDKPYNCIIHYWQTVTDLAGMADILPLPESWHELILFGACWRGYLDLGDMARYSEMNDLQLQKISVAVPTQAKEEIDTKMAHVEVPGRSYP